jgi:hypothetical protein
VRRLLALLAVAATALPAAAGERVRPIDAAPAARSCSRYGQGFVEVPGTSTCIRIGGRVRADYGVTSRRVISRDQITGFAPSGTVSADVRTETGMGPLRAYVRTRAGGGPFAR